MKMTKSQVVAHCREIFKSPDWPFVKSDVDAKRQYFNDYTDMLCKDGMITELQYSTWTNPF